MYIVGHYVTTLLSQRFRPHALDGPQAAALYLPDFARCHGWGYVHCFSLPDDDASAALIKAHLLGDWWVHFGDGASQQRRGWAYRRMAVFACRYDAFFDTAARRGLLQPGAHRDSVRGFSHTLMEYALDTHLAQALSRGAFESLRGVASQVGAADGAWSSATVRALLAAHGVEGDFSGLEADMASFRERAARARSPAEFAYRAGVTKFKLRDCDASVELVAETVRAGLAELPADELDRVVAQGAAFIGRHVHPH